MYIDIPGYKIHEEIYESPRSKIFIANKESNNEIFALKILNNEYPSKHEIAKFQHEYQIHKKINSTGVAKVYDLNKLGNNLVMVMEYINGGDISDLISSDRLISLDLFFDIAIQLTHSIGEIHQQFVIHKDIKPKNILWDSKHERVKIIDFGIAGELSNEKQKQVAEIFGGSLSYMSPEQTGRMNRPVDYRTDFYSLGVTLFELLTGHLPFEGNNDIIGWIHSHIAKNPKRVSEFRTDVPELVSDIIEKLMSKTAEDRYKSAFGLKYDLEMCRKMYVENTIIENFSLCEYDISDRFEIPEKLYGREKEINLLMDLFSDAAKGSFSSLLVSGYSGVGKSSLINEVHKPIVEKNGYFLEGKFDQFQRNIPYSAISKAFSRLIKQLLSESAEDLEKWKNEILDTLGNNAQVLVEIIPDLERVIGIQPEVPHLGTEENQNRFNNLFKKFLKIFTKSNHPLVLFIDDLQWADLATLNLMKLFTTEDTPTHFFFIGAYRDNEINEHHPFIQTLDNIRKKGVDIPILTLAPLNLHNVNQLISETVNEPTEEVESLSKLVIKKTNGNPFFVNQFLKSIYSNNFLIFNFDEKKWEWNVERIKEKDISNNVVDLMVKKLTTLPQETQDLIKLGACIGNSFNLKTLSIISEKNIFKVAKDLWPAVRAGHIIAETDGHSLLKELDETQISSDDEFPDSIDKFLHDRVQQAAYLLIDEDKKKEVHLKIGRLLLKDTPKDEIELAYFDIVEHLNKGIDLIENKNEKLNLAKLNLISADKAKEATAYAPAKSYYLKGLKLINSFNLNKHYELAFKLKKGLLEVEFLLSNVEDAVKLATSLISECKNNEEKVEVNSILILYYGGAGEMDKAIEIALSTLKIYKTNIPRYPTMFDLVKQLIISKSNLIGQTPDSLKNMDKFTDNKTHIIFSLLKELIAPAYLQGDTNLLPYIILKMFNLTLKHGNGPVASFAYAGYGLLWAKLNNFEESYKFGKLAMEYNSFVNYPPMEARVYFMTTSFSLYWKKSICKLSEPRKIGLIKLIETGEYFWASYMYLFGFWQEVILSKSMREIVDLADREKNFAEKAKQTEPYHVHRLHRNLFMNFMNTIPDNKSLDYEKNEEKSASDYFEKNKTSTMGIFYHTVCKIINNFYFERYDEALDAAVNPSITKDVITDGTFTRVIYTFYTCLTILKKYKTLNHEHKKIYKRNKDDLRKWVSICHENFAFMWLIILAEEYSIKKDQVKALDYFEKAIKIAGDLNSLMFESLANELLAKYFLSINKDKLAFPYMSEAVYLYYRWEAISKVNFLQEKYSHIINQAKSIKDFTQYADTIENSQSLLTVSSSSKDSIRDNLDLETLQKASQALSSEIVMDKLILKLKSFLIENAGAEFGALLIKREQTLMIEAKGALEDDKEIDLIPVSLDKSDEIAKSVVRYSLRTKEEIVLDDASRTGMFKNDVYIKKKQVKSLMCIPLITKDEVSGILYLENNLTTHAFTKNRVKILKMLSSEIAIALDNAKLYQNLEEYSKTLEDKVSERTKALNSMNEELISKNINITSSIKYAKRIQNAVLPDMYKIRESINEIFIIFEPKDIVSGDFYWYSKIDDSLFFAVVDCTGHGVPGAFLSMIGNTLLNKIVNENKILQPSIILENLHNEIRSALNQEKNQNKKGRLEQLDGMDISLSKINFKENYLEYAGAKRSLFIAKETNSQIEISEVKGDKKSIGGRQKEEKRVFTNNHVAISKGDMIYMFSDGYVDQQNINNKRFGMKRLQELILNIANEEVKVQEEVLLKELREHMTDEQQRDDITLVGIKV